MLAGQLELPEGAELVTDPRRLVVNVTQQISAEALEAELAEAEAEAGIEHEEAEEAAGGRGAEEGRERRRRDRRGGRRGAPSDES